MQLCEGAYSGAIKRFHLLKDLKIVKGYIGYTVLSYIAKFIKGERRPTQAFEELISKFPEEVYSTLGKYSQFPDNLKMGEIPNMYSLAPLAQSNACPIGALTAADGLVGANFGASKNMHSIFTRIAGEIKNSIEL